MARTRDRTTHGTCPRCKETKPVSEFGKQSQNSDGLAAYCKPCDRERKLESNARVKARDPEAWRERRRGYVRAYRERHPDRVAESERKRNLRLKFGITVEEYNALLEKQGGVCGICEDPPTVKALAVDHHHDTGVIRGLLCSNCNTALGLMKDDLDRLERAVNYLREN